jgi:hypothetical protein
MTEARKPEIMTTVATPYRGNRRNTMNSAERLVFAIQVTGPDRGAHRKRRSPERVMLVLVLVILASMAVVSAVGPADSENLVLSEGTEAARLEALVRFCTDRYERAAHADSADCRAKASYVGDVFSAEEFSGIVS